MFSNGSFFHFVIMGQNREHIFFFHFKMGFLINFKEPIGVFFHTFQFDISSESFSDFPAKQ